MSRYGIVRPCLSGIESGLRYIVRRARALWRQRRIEVDGPVRIAHDVEVLGEGRIVISSGVEIRSRVILKAGAGALIELDANTVIEEGCFIEACAGHTVKLGAGCRLKREVIIRSVAGVELGSGSELGMGTQVGPREPSGNGRLVMGHNVHLQHGCIIDLCADVIIGDDVRSGAYCTWYTHNHLPAVDQLIWDRGIECAPIRLGAGVWLGQACIFLPGVEVGAKSVVAAGAVVTKNFEAATIIGGVPAKLIRHLELAEQDVARV